MIFRSALATTIVISLACTSELQPGGAGTGGAGGAPTADPAADGGVTPPFLPRPDAGEEPPEVRFDFEIDEQHWRDISTSRGLQGSIPFRSNEQVFAGMWSLKYAIVTTGAPLPDQPGVIDDTRVVGVIGMHIGTLPAGATAFFRVWIPPAHHLQHVQAFMQTRASNSWRAHLRRGDDLQAGAWNEFRVGIPIDYAGEPLELGILFVTDGAWAGDVHIDAIAFQPPPGPEAL